MPMPRTRVLTVHQTIDGLFVLAFAAAVGWILLHGALVHGQSPRNREGLREPVYRISKTNKRPTPGDQATAVHPLDPALEMARKALAHIEGDLHDYTCTLVKRERVGGELLPHEFIECKIRHPGKRDGVAVPFSVYLKFRKPDNMRGREVIYVAGRNSDKITAHEGGIKGRFLPTVNLLPTSALALRGNRYPVTEIGIKTLTERLIEKGERDRELGICKVRFVDGAKVAKRPCTMLEVRHDEANPAYDFHVARVFLDKQLGVPIRYEAYDWPSSEDGKPVLIEEYTYIDLKTNVGLTDEDFDRENPNYRF